MEEREERPSAAVPRWALYAVLMLGPFGLLPIALSRKVDRGTRWIVAAPIILSAVPILALIVVLAIRILH